MIIGIFGRSAAEVDRIAFQCGRIMIQRSGSAWVPVATATSASGEHGGGGGGAFSYNCPASHPVGRRFDGNSGARIDAIRLYCSEITVTPL